MLLFPVRNYLDALEAMYRDEGLGLLVPRTRAIQPAIQHRNPGFARHAAIAQLAGVDDLVTETFRTDPLSAKEVSYDH